MKRNLLFIVIMLITLGIFAQPLSKSSLQKKNKTDYARYKNSRYVITSLPWLEGFETATANTSITLDSWTNYIEAGSRDWSGKEYNSNKYAQFSAYSSGDASNIAWLVSPEINFDSHSGEILTFRTKTGYYKHAGLTVWISTNYDGTNVGSATWTQLSATFATGPSGGYGDWVNSGNINLSGYAGTGYIAFKYVGDGTTNTTTFQVDNVSISTTCALSMLPFSEGYENFANNDYIADNSALWDTWSSAPATAEDAKVSTNFASTGTKSMLINGTNDMILPLCDATSGKYQVDFKMYVETGKCGYFNIQHVLGTEWAFEVYLSENGTGHFSIANKYYKINYTKDAWNAFSLIVNLDDDNIQLNINGTRIKSWKFSNTATVSGTNKLSVINFYAGAENGETPQYYVDDINITEITSTSACTEGGTSQNLYSILIASTHQVMYNADINTLVFVHRALNLGSGNSGELAYDISTDGGNTWVTENYLSPNMNTNNAPCRYPSATIYNPTGNTSANNAYIVGVGPSLDGTNGWAKTFRTSAKLDGTNVDDWYGSVNGDNTDFHPYGLTITPNGTAWYISTNYDGNESGTYTTFKINKGIFNSGTNKFDWSVNKTVSPNLYFEGGNKISNDWDIVFSPDGSVGYFVINCVENGETLKVPVPHVWKTTDNGNTWTKLPNINYDNFPELNNYLAKETTLKPYITDVDLTVDNNNRLHIFAEVWSGKDNYNNVFDAFEGGTTTRHFIDFSTQDGTEWDMLYISPKNSDTYSFGGTNHNSMPEVSRKADGSIIFYTWTETTGNTVNSNPDIMLAAARPGGNLSAIKNLSNGTCSDNLAFFKQISPIVKENGTFYEIPTFYAVLGADDVKPTAYNYAKGIGIDDSEVPAIVTPTASISSTPGCNLGSITVNSDQNTRQTFYLLNNSGTTLQTWRGVTNTHEFTNLTEATYKAKVRKMDISSAISSPETLSKLEATTITTHPTSQSVCEGGSVSFLVAATGDGTLTYQWKKGTSNISGATSATYTINGVTTSNSGNYSCIVTGTCGQSTSNSATLTINPATTIVTQPSGGTICEGDNHMFSVSATGSGALSYQWKKNGSDISGATNSTYTVSNASASDAGDYICVVTSSCSALNSNPATLIINSTTTITDESSNQEACIGSNVHFYVTATGTGTLTYQWKKNGSDISGATSSTYDLTSIDNTDAGTYTCYVTGDCGNTTSSPMVLSITTSITLGDPSNENVCLTETATFTVVANGTNTTFQWKKDGTDMTDGGDISGATTATLTIANCDASDEADYKCAVTSDCGSATSEIATLSLNEATTIINESESQEACVGSNVNFSVTASGTGTLLYQWKKDGSDISGANSPTYSLTNIDNADAGTYTCLVTGDCGNITSSSMILTIATSLTLGNPSDANVCLAQAATFTVVANATNTTFQWKKDGTNISNGGDINGATSETLSILNCDISDEGDYTCAVTSDCGNATSEIATLSINDVTSITTQPVSISDANIGDAVSFNVVAEGTNLTYQWKHDNTEIVGATSDTYNIASVTADDAGNYIVTVTGDCGNETSNIITLSVATSIKELAEFGISIYPNPSNGVFTIELNDFSDTNIEISDVSGKIIYRNSALSNKNSIDLSRNAKGIYFIKINNGTKVHVAKIILD